MIGTLQALEVLKVITGVGGELYKLVVISYNILLLDVLTSKLLMFDGLLSSFRVIKLRSRDPACVVCGETPSITKLIDYEVFCNSSANDKVVMLHGLHMMSYDVIGETFVNTKGDRSDFMSGRCGRLHPQLSI